MKPLRPKFTDKTNKLVIFCRHLSLHTQKSWENQGTMLWFFKYFRRKFSKKWRFWLKTKLKYAKFWS
jgi:hypothetical protein